jgi:protein-L-isoaspartate(D-aspartate) O-methyltransferase
MDKKILTRSLRYHYKKSSTKTPSTVLSEAMPKIPVAVVVKNTNERRDPYEVARRRMITEQLLPRGIKDERVIAAMGRVKRHEFVTSGMENQAYLDRPLQIGFGQTISQPLIVALMTEELKLSGNERVLEIGTGSGYQAAVLAEIVEHVFSIERIPDLSERAAVAINAAGYRNVTLKIGDGSLGWKEKAPFDRIIVTAGAPCVPDALKEQLSNGGFLVIPVGDEEIQNLNIIRKDGDVFQKRIATACRFVRLVGQQGWSEK